MFSTLEAGCLGSYSAEACPGADMGGSFLVDDELVDRVVIDIDGRLAILHLHLEVVILGGDLGLGLYGEGVSPIPDHEVRLLAVGLFHYLLDGLSIHASLAPSLMILEVCRAHSTLE